MDRVVTEQSPCPQRGGRSAKALKWEYAYQDGQNSEWEGEQWEKEGGGGGKEGDKTGGKKGEWETAKDGNNG